MAIEFRCIRCGQKLRVKDVDAGNLARCPKCKAVVDIPPKYAPDQPVAMAREKSDVIDFELFGQEAQYVEITLDPGEVTFARMENLFYAAPGIAMEDAVETRGGNRESGGVFQRISQVARLTREGGDSLRMTGFCNVAERREVVAFVPSSSRQLVPLLMEEFDEQLICRGDAILCLARGIEIRDRDLTVISEELSLRELRGDGIAVLQVGGQPHHRRLGERDVLQVATRHIVAFTSEIRVSRCDNTGVEAPVEVTMLSGPGEIWLGSGSLHN